MATISVTYGSPPRTYRACDYGIRNSAKAFVDSCHEISVIGNNFGLYDLTADDADRLGALLQAAARQARHDELMEKLDERN